MKKAVFGLFFALMLNFMFITSCVFAKESNPNNQLELLETLKTFRSEIYQKLDLTKEQKNEIKTLDEKLYEDITPKVMQVHFYMQKIKTLAKSEFVTKDEVDEVKREFDKTDKEISVIKKAYEKNFAKILNKEQKNKYKLLKKEKQEQLQKELKEDIKKQKLKN